MNALRSVTEGVSLPILINTAFARDNMEEVEVASNELPMGVFQTSSVIQGHYKRSLHF
jgi:mannose/fructose-specific phosphotransferase system component IIA